MTQLVTEIVDHLYPTAEAEHHDSILDETVTPVKSEVCELTEAGEQKALAQTGQAVAAAPEQHEQSAPVTPCPMDVAEPVSAMVAEEFDKAEKAEKLKGPQEEARFSVGDGCCALSETL